LEIVGADNSAGMKRKELFDDALQKLACTRPSYAAEPFVHRDLRKLHSFWLTNRRNIPTIINVAIRVPTTSDTTQFPIGGKSGGKIRRAERRAFSSLSWLR
jgi:hypothetical protein